MAIRVTRLLHLRYRDAVDERPDIQAVARLEKVVLPAELDHPVTAVDDVTAHAITRDDLVADVRGINRLAST